MFSSTAGGVIRFTTDGSDVNSSSTRYTGPVTFTTSVTIRARVFKDGSGSSDKGATFIVTAVASGGTTGTGGATGGTTGGAVVVPGTTSTTIAAPVISPAGGTFSGPVEVEISVAERVLVPRLLTAGATQVSKVIRYTTNGDAVTAGSPVYGGKFTVAVSTTVRARVFEGTNGSAETVAVFTFSAAVERFGWARAYQLALAGEWVRWETWPLGRVMRGEAGLGNVLAALVCYQSNTLSGVTTVIYWVAREEDIGAMGFSAVNWVRGTAPANGGSPGTP
jgi:hypothetical protein